MPDHQSSTSQPPPASRVTLQVGERRFTTTLDTLTDESLYFKSFLSGRWTVTQDDGSCFVDADPELFSHILRYLRRGVLPIFYDNVTGHNHALYALLFEEAKYFQIARLEKWLSKKRYLEAVTTRCSVDVFEGLFWVDTSNSLGVEEHFPRWVKERVYLCPRRIPVHRGYPEKCGRACATAQGEDADEYEDENVLKTLVIRKTILVDHQALVGRRDDGEEMEEEHD